MEGSPPPWAPWACVPEADLFAQGGTAQFRGGEADYDAFAKLASNENNFGPPESVMQAMNDAWKYANRYGYPDGTSSRRSPRITASSPRTSCSPPVLVKSSMSSATAFLDGGKKVVGADPTYGTVYQHATNIKAEAIKVPLLKDYRQDIAGDDQGREQERRGGRASSTSATRTTRPA